MPPAVPVTHNPAAAPIALSRPHVPRSVLSGTDGKPQWRTRKSSKSPQFLWFCSGSPAGCPNVGHAGQLCGTERKKAKVNDTTPRRMGDGVGAPNRIELVQKRRDVELGGMDGDAEPQRSPCLTPPRPATPGLPVRGTSAGHRHRPMARPRWMGPPLHRRPHSHQPAANPARPRAGRRAGRPAPGPR